MKNVMKMKIAGQILAGLLWARSTDRARTRRRSDRSRTRDRLPVSQWQVAAAELAWKGQLVALHVRLSSAPIMIGRGDGRK